MEPLTQPSRQPRPSVTSGNSSFTTRSERPEFCRSSVASSPRSRPPPAVAVHMGEAAGKAGTLLNFAVGGEGRGYSNASGNFIPRRRPRPELPRLRQSPLFAGDALVDEIPTLTDIHEFAVGSPARARRLSQSRAVRAGRTPKGLCENSTGAWFRPIRLPDSGFAPITPPAPSLRCVLNLVITHETNQRSSRTANHRQARPA